MVGWNVLLLEGLRRGRRISCSVPATLPGHQAAVTVCLRAAEGAGFNVCYIEPHEGHFPTLAEGYISEDENASICEVWGVPDEDAVKRALSRWAEYIPKFYFGGPFPNTEVLLCETE